MSPGLLIRPAVAADFDSARRLLQSAGLPVADLDPAQLQLCIEKDDQLQGVIGIEHFGSVALLRSLAITTAARGVGAGAALVTALEASAAAAGVGEMWLLTIDADAFFSRLGYQQYDRTDAPAPIQETEEFSSLCPGDAILMCKRLTAFSIP
ncbi:MAG: GNAT family N-acetyltransferase [Gammaproteobacteria bacterium]|nr:GNAT family N-acetyltransferase [Gammaproteobacteria bacterium]